MTALQQDVSVSQWGPDSGVTLIQINRPSTGNALTAEIGQALQHALAVESRRARCIVLGSAGGVFCAGVDLNAVREYASIDSDDALRQRIYGSFQGLIREVVSSRVPVVARIQGACLGLGADLALACDIRIAASGAWFEESWIKLGLTSALGGGHILPATVGSGNALEMLFTARRVYAEEAHRLGIYQRVVDPGDLDREVDSVARNIAAADPRAIAATKDLVRADERAALANYLERALVHQVALIRSPEFRERVADVLRGLAKDASSRPS